MLFSCFYKSFHIFQGFSFCPNATASKGKEILHVLLLKLRQGFHEKIPRAWNPAWAPIDGREGKSIPAEETNRCSIHGCINKVILINSEIHSLPPTADCLALLGRIQGDSATCARGHETGPKVAAMQARHASYQPVLMKGIQPQPRHPQRVRLVIITFSITDGLKRAYHQPVLGPLMSIPYMLF